MALACNVSFYPAHSKLLPGYGDQACADGVPSARIADCARMKSISPHAIGDLVQNPHAVFGVNNNRIF